MKPDIKFDDVQWASTDMVSAVHFYGTNGDGEVVDYRLNYGEPVHIGSVHELVAKLNGGSFHKAQ